MTLLNDEDEDGEPMATDRMGVLELLRKEASDTDLDFLRDGCWC